MEVWELDVNMKGWVLLTFHFSLLHFLLTLFLWQIGAHHSEVDFAVRGNEPKDEVQIYTWKDATLRELTDLVCYLSFTMSWVMSSYPLSYIWLNNSILLAQKMILVLCQVKEIAPEARRRNARLSFAFVYPDKRGRFVVKQVLAPFSLSDTCMHRSTLLPFLFSNRAIKMR